MEIDFKARRKKASTHNDQGSIKENITIIYMHSIGAPRIARPNANNMRKLTITIVVETLILTPNEYIIE